MKSSLIAMSLGTLGLGIAEFIMPGILSYVANDLDISITTAGHLISAYALGVCFGAPIILLSVENFRLKNVLLFLAGLIFLGNFLAAISVNYYMLLVARFVSGLPHGAYFGVASIMAAKLADRGKSSTAVAIMVAGMTVANLVGVPAGTFLSENFSWHTIFFGVCGVAAAIFFAIKIFVPDIDNEITPKLSDRFKFLKHGAPWLLLVGTMFGNCGIFCYYSYINPLLVNVSDFEHSQLSWIMVVAGVGMVAGNLISGRICDRYAPGLVAALTQAMEAVLLIGAFYFSNKSLLSVALMFGLTFCLFALSSPQQLSIIRYSKGGEKLGAALIQVAFNLGNAVGAAAGGLPIDAGFPENYCAIVGIPFAFLGFCAHGYFHYRYEVKRQRIID